MTKQDVSFRAVEIKDPSRMNRISFRFDEFNTVRHSRGAPAARVYIDQHDGQGEFWLWMSEADLEKNIKEFDEKEELEKALEHYRSMK